MATTLRKIYQLKITLKGSKPPIWRRFLINSSVKLPVFHDAVQIVMGWTNSHMHQFTAEGTIYGLPDPDWDMDEIKDETKYRLDQLLQQEKDTMTYEYDFGDGWEHTLLLEKILPFDPESVLPVCIKAKGACPPEDVGGIWGYYEFLQVISDPKHPEHEDIREWYGEEFDSAFYDLDEVNQLLIEYCK